MERKDQRPGNPEKEMNRISDLKLWIPESSKLTYSIGGVAAKNREDWGT